MTRPSRYARVAEVLISTGAFSSAVAPWLADWNRGHTFGPGYGPHARWHGASEVVAATAEGVLALWLLRTGRQESTPAARACVSAAALLPVLRWGPFNVTLLRRDTSAYEEGRPPMRILGAPAPLVAQDAIAAISLAGWLLHRFGHRLGG
ncbi:MAG: hypothetical protein M3Q27_13535 [Actinomycetota bacterium]|nr:hypothetical protein [Actinomycetota bacterium]